MAEKKFGDRTVRVSTILATDAIILQARLMKIIGPALERLPTIFAGRGSKATDDDRKASDGAAIVALAEIFAKADPEQVAKLIKDITEMASISYDGGKNYSPIDFDGEFSGPNMKDIFPVTAFILKETLGDFFSGALASGRQAGKTAGA